MPVLFKHRHLSIRGTQGGPLLSDDGKLIGVNAFKSEGEALNFAISVVDVSNFLKAQKSVIASAEQCKSQILFEGRDKADDASIRQVSTHCDDFADLIFRVARQ